MKYIIVKQNVTEYYLPIVFSEELIHSQVAKGTWNDGDVVSAGFVYRDKDKWFVTDKKSESLNMGPSKDDEKILNLFLVEGVSGLDLANRLILQLLKL